MHLHASSMHRAAEVGARELLRTLLAEAGQAALRLEASDEEEALHDFQGCAAPSVETLGSVMAALMDDHVAAFLRRARRIRPSLATDRSRLALPH